MYQKSKSKDIIANPVTIDDIVTKTMDQMATIIATTIGPGGRCVLIERDGMPPLATKDGVTVAKALGVANSAANIIIDSAKEICLNTAKEAGDGTTTAIIVANALVKAGKRFFELNSKANPQKIVSELRWAYDKVIVPAIQALAVPVTSEEQMYNVALISANGDEEIAASVVKAVLGAGEDGTVLIEEAQGKTMFVEQADGYVITTGLKDLGQIGPVFINDRGNQQVKMDVGRVVLFDGSLNDMSVPSKLQDAITDQHGMTDGKPIIVMAHNFSDVVLDAFAKHSKKGLLVVPVKTPRFGVPNGASMFLQDMAAYTGGKVYDPGNLDTMNINGLGIFTSARVNMYETYLSSDVDEEAIEERVQELRSIENAAFSEFDKSHLRAAIAKLTGGVSTIHVGGATDLEIRERKARVEDAVEAVRSAIAEGVVPGGCTMHLLIAKTLWTHEARKPSWSILHDALHEPIDNLLRNCGEEPEVIVGQLLNAVNVGKMPTVVFDAQQHVFGNPMELGIIEPAKVCRVALNNALSVASLLMTLGGIVVVPRDAAAETQIDLAKTMFNSMLKDVE